MVCVPQETDVTLLPQVDFRGIEGGLLPNSLSSMWTRPDTYDHTLGYRLNSSTALCIAVRSEKANAVNPNRQIWNRVT